MSVLGIITGFLSGVPPLPIIFKFFEKIFGKDSVWPTIIIAVIIIGYIIYYWSERVERKSKYIPSKDVASNRKNSLEPKFVRRVINESKGEIKPKHPNETTVYDKSTVAVEAYEPAKSSIQVTGCLACGETLRSGRYRIINYISHGGFGNTYIAEDLLLNKYVALKELFLRDICSRQAQTGVIQISIETNRIAFDNLKRKFIKEAKRLRSFNSPNIIKVYDCFEEKCTAYYTMDYISGNSLASIVKEKGKMKETTLRKLLPGLLDALRLVHNEKIWHLDIKPANLMLRDKASIVLIDFGASKQFENKDGMTLTSSSAICYTTGYAPPEQISNNTKNIGAWTDIYALGATLYNLLTGEKPPQIDEIVSEGLPPFPSDVSDNMIKAITTMMQPNRNTRPQTISEVEQLLGFTSYRGNNIVERKKLQPL